MARCLRATLVENGQAGRSDRLARATKGQSAVGVLYEHTPDVVRFDAGKRSARSFRHSFPGDGGPAHEKAGVAVVLSARDEISRCPDARGGVAAVERARSSIR